MCVFLVYLPQFKHRVRAILTQEFLKNNSSLRDKWKHSIPNTLLTFLLIFLKLTLNNGYS